MRGIILVNKQDGRRSILVPDASIQIYVTDTGDGQRIVCAFRTDGTVGFMPDDTVPILEHLAQTCAFTSPVEVPQAVVDFALESERARMASVDALATAFSEAFKEADLHHGFQHLIEVMEAARDDQAEESAREREIAAQIDALFTNARGLS